MSAGSPLSLCVSLYFSTVMSTAFYGITCMQTLFYYVHYHHDSLRMKSLVAAVCAFNTIHEALTISGSYKYIMAGLMNPPSISNGVPELFVQILFTGLVAILTQGYFIYRIYDSSGKNMVAPLIWVPLAFYQIVAPAIYVGKTLYSADGVRVAELAVLHDSLFRDLAISCLSVSAGVDVLIAIFLMSLLLRKGTATRFTGAPYVFQHLTAFAINTGIWPAMFAFLTLMLYFYPSSPFYMLFGIPLCSVYCHTLLANLNARPHVRGEMSTDHHGDSWVTGSCNIFHQQSGETKSNHTSGTHSEHHHGVTSPDANMSVEWENV
ncbi:hypothetical protein OG21DRAFT_1507250 [Imleria badia]|nr:hypothetical protein OG21DRAFT_1507250 [Imleria badia]